MKKKQLRKSEIKDLLKSIEQLYGQKDLIKKNDSVISVETEKNEIVMVDGKPLFFYDGGLLIPSLKLLQQIPLLKAVTVDMGAVKFVTNGADIMRPGITLADSSIGKDEYVRVIDEKNGVALSVSKTLYSGEDMMKMDSGKVMVNIHRVGDEVWNISL